MNRGSGLAWEGPKLVLALVLFWLRHRYFTFDGFDNWILGLTMVPQFVGYQKILSPDQPSGLVQGLEWSQWGWFFFALALPGEGPALGCLGFLMAQALIKAPLQALVRRDGLRHRFLILLGLLAVVGCLPFSSFSAYFQAFLPLMSVGDQVSTMTQKLYSGEGLWAVIVMLSVVYQSGALGYFYWDKIMKAPLVEENSATAWPMEAWLAAAGLFASAALGLCPRLYGPIIHSALFALGVGIH